MRATAVLIVAASLLSLSARADDERTRRAREELERQLAQLVDIPPPRVEVQFEGLDEPNLKLVEADFTLDGATLPAKLEELNRPGTHVIFSGQVKPGDHQVGSRVVYQDSSSIVLSNEAGYKWKVVNNRSFGSQRGIAVTVVVRPEVNPGVRNVKDKLRLATSATPTMLARLEDATMPEPPPRPVTFDAGAPAAAESQADAQRREAQEARAARLAAQEEARAARLAAQEEARAARLAAVERKQRGSEARPQDVASRPPPEPEVAAAPESPPAEATPSPMTSDAGALVASAPAVPAAAADDEERGSSRLSVPLLVALVAAGLALVVFFAMRRRR